MSTFFGCYAQIPRFNCHVDLQIRWICLDFEVQRPRRSLLNLFHAGFILDPCLASSIRMLPIIYFKHVLSTFFVEIKSISVSSARERERERCSEAQADGLRIWKRCWIGLKDSDGSLKSFESTEFALLQGWEHPRFGDVRVRVLVAHFERLHPAVQWHLARQVVLGRTWWHRRYKSLACRQTSWWVWLVRQWRGVLLCTKMLSCAMLRLLRLGQG